MKASETVIKLKSVPKQIFENQEDTIQTKTSYVAGWKDGTEAQAEITWDKAIRKVVEWIEKKILPWGTDADEIEVAVFRKDEWQPKLKEWGIK